MPYVVTQSCCADASCVVACPVNCIHPAPGEPGFAEAEMLFIDAKACVGCGACATACPVDAILVDTKLSPAQQPFAEYNASYYEAFAHHDRTPLALVPKQRRLTSPEAGPFRVAVVGAGPAGLYVADELLRHPELRVDVYDRLPTPYGLLRAGVAPDHPHTKQAAKLFSQIESEPGFRYFLGVEVGRDLSHEELAEHYHAVAYCVGASADRSLEIPGIDLSGSMAATEVVAWYNGHPDRRELTLPLDTERAVVVGNGNVALDVARILSVDPADLAETDIADHALAALETSLVREVVVLGRRGAAQAAFTTPELIGLAGLQGVNVVIDPRDVEAGALDGLDTAKSPARVRVLRDLAGRTPEPGLRTIVLRFLGAPVAVHGDGRVRGVEIARTRLETDATGAVRAVVTEETETIEAGLLLRSVGYHGRPLAGLPYDAATGTVPNDEGRVEPGVYVAGWIKRGPTGFIGTNKSCAQGTVERILDDLDAGVLRQPESSRRAIVSLARLRCRGLVDLNGWRAIDAEERRRGAESGRPRVKITDPAEMTRIAHEAERNSLIGRVSGEIGKVGEQVTKVGEQVTKVGDQVAGQVTRVGEQVTEQVGERVGRVSERMARGR